MHECFIWRKNKVQNCSKHLQSVYVHSSNYNMKNQMLHYSMRANIRPVQSAIWTSLLLLDHPSHSARCRHRFRPGGVYRYNAMHLLRKENAQWTKLAVSWTWMNNDMICYDMWYDKQCPKHRFAKLWGLSFWAVSQCDKNSPDNRDFYAEHLCQEGSCHQGHMVWFFFNFDLAISLTAIHTDPFDICKDESRCWWRKEMTATSRTKQKVLTQSMS